MMNDKKVLFDPGYAPLVINSIGQVGYTYYIFNAMPNNKLKKVNFIQTLNKINKQLKTNISFYLGCLLWASYISKIENCEIEGNKLLNEETNEEEYTSEINFLIDLIEKQLPRDSKYYQNKNFEADERYLNILKTYKEFLILNEGFVNCSNTSQIKLPKNINEKIDTELIYNNIQKALNNKNIEELLDSYELILA